MPGIIHESRGLGHTGQTQQIKATPIVVNGTIYITTPDNLWAVDARSGRQIWRYTYPSNDGFHIGHRGVAVYKDLVYLTTPDAHLVALDARDGGAGAAGVLTTASGLVHWRFGEQRDRASGSVERGLQPPRSRRLKFAQAEACALRAAQVVAQ